MENELIDKKDWQAPEVMDLDVNLTGSGTLLNPIEGTSHGYDVGPS